ncbi:MAG TPA: putative zinc-binding metallopeptidase [Candidatus Angelobacter sp.]|nr:putative zinc-binding metallopeptidase [Candidatus Angelobacter sp.]
MRVHEIAPKESQELLDKPIRELGLKLEGSPLEPLVARLYRELDRKGLKRFRPGVYLTDEWGCPSGEPIIGIPFYLADPRLSRLEKEINDLEDHRQIMMYLRHEAGHALNYAYGLYKTPEWKQLFGPYRRRYRDDYRPVAFSRSYVRHMEGWYAQKHPDEDFAETFAVWLTPGSGWRKRYKDWPALAKLKYVDRVARQFGDAEPARPRGRKDITVDDMETTVAGFYEDILSQQPSPGDLPLDADLQDIFKVGRRRKRGLLSAAELLRSHRKPLVDKLVYWTGVQRPLVRKLVETMETRLQQLGLQADVKKEREYLTELTVYATALAMNYITRGKFVQS